MGCVALIPERDFELDSRGELTPVSADVFVSIPQRDSEYSLYYPLLSEYNRR